MDGHRPLKNLNPCLIWSIQLDPFKIMVLLMTQSTNILYPNIYIIGFIVDKLGLFNLSQTTKLTPHHYTFYLFNISTLWNFNSHQTAEKQELYISGTCTSPFLVFHKDVLRIIDVCVSFHFCGGTVKTYFFKKNDRFSCNLKSLTKIKRMNNIALIYFPNPLPAAL